MKNKEIKVGSKRISIYFYENGEISAFVERGENDGDPRRPDAITHWRRIRKLEIYSDIVEKIKELYSFRK